MTYSDQQDDPFGDRLEIIRLLDELSRLREDPGRRSDLKLTHARLSERLRRSIEGERSSLLKRRG